MAAVQTHYCAGAETPTTRAIVFASTTGCALSGNMNTFMPTIPMSLMTRTTTIALASAVRGRKAAATKAPSDARIARKDDRSFGKPAQGPLDDHPERLRFSN